MPAQPPLPTKLLAISTKMYFSHSQSLTYAHALQETFGPTSTLLSTSPSPSSSPKIIYIPSLPSLHPCSLTFSTSSSSRTPTSIWLGAQTCHWEDRGAWTGEVSPSELSTLGVSIVEIGHAERRFHFNETDEIVLLKTRAVVRNGMIPLVCVGERTRESLEKAREEVEAQVRGVLEEGSEKGERVVFAYEPVWAIGAEKPAGLEWVRGVVEGIRRVVKEKGREGDVRVVYGGSAGPGTWKELRGVVDGLFLGRFAHEVENVKKVWLEMVGGEEAKGKGGGGGE